MYSKALKYLFVVICLMCLAACKKQEKIRVIRLAHGLNVNHSVHQAMLKMGEELALLSNGTMILKIYPNQQLGTERECLELLQIGSLDMTKVSVGVLENFAPKMKALGLPFLFRDREHAFKVLDGPIGEELLNEGIKYKLKGLAYYDAGSRSFYTKDNPVTSPADLKGKKIRVMESPTSIEMVRELGGAPTPISWGELYTSLQQGVVDGAENNPPSFYLSKHYEVCKYYVLDEHTTLPDVLVAGTDFWNSLSEQQKGWLKEAALKSVTYQRKLWAASEEEALDAVRREGVQVITPDKTLFSEQTSKIYDRFTENPEMYQLINAIKNYK